MKRIAIIAASAMFCMCMLASCSGGSSTDNDNDCGKPAPKTAEEAASHYYYDSEGHLHRDH